MISSPDVVAQRIKVTTEIRQLAPNIGKDTEELLADMYSAKQLVGTAHDEPISIREAKISIAQGAQMNQLIRQSETNHSLEVGFAYGFSTIWILDGLRSRKNSRHVAIDPFETTYWGGVGLHQVKRLNVTAGFEWIDEFSIHALSTLIKKGRSLISFTSTEIIVLMTSLSTSICPINWSRREDLCFLTMCRCHRFGRSSALS